MIKKTFLIAGVSRGLGLTITEPEFKLSSEVCIEGDRSQTSNILAL